MEVAVLVKDAIGSILKRDLDALRREVEAYSNDAELWRPVPGIANVAGTLVLHLAGNLQHYFGAQLGRSGYVRNRPAEFARRDVPRAELLREIDAARTAVKAGLAGFSPEQLTSEFSETIGGAKLTTGEFLLHLLTHFAYHLGQIDYHRRVVTGSPTAVGAMRAAELSSSRSAGVEA
jgi:uncharacterized damage-inducible protein DinB